MAGGIQQLDLRAHDLRRAAALRVDDHQRRQAGHFVDLLGDRHAFLDVLEPRLAGEFRDDRAGQRVPVRQHRAGLEGLVGLDVQRRTVRHLVALALAAVLVGDDDLAGTRNHHQLALAVGHVAHRGVEADETIGLRVHAGSHRGTRGRATDVEGPHRQLRAWLADRLRGDDADSRAKLHQLACGQITPIAFRADAAA